MGAKFVHTTSTIYKRDERKLPQSFTPCIVDVHLYKNISLAHYRVQRKTCDNRGKCRMDEKTIQCLSNASHLQHVPIYLQPFLRYSKLLVENCDIFLPPCI